MKKKSRILLIICSLAFFGCQNQAVSQVPKVVEKAFKLKYPNENDPDWEIDAHGNYESYFKKEGVKYRADFSPEGIWIETETSISKKDLPKSIREAIKKNYSKEEIAEIEKVDSALKGEFYDVEFKQKGKNKDVEYRPSGEEL